MSPEPTPPPVQPPVYSPVQARRAWERSLVAITLGAVFLGAGISKQIKLDYWIETFTGWGYPAWFLQAVGLVEILASILVLIPATRLVGAGLIAVVMVGAVATHLFAGQLLAAVVPLSMLALAALLLGPLRPPTMYQPPVGTTPSGRNTQTA